MPIFCFAIEEMLACYCLYGVKDGKFMGFFFSSLFVAFTATFMWFLMCWLPQLGNQLGYMFALIFEIYASAMFFCAHQLFDQLNSGKEKREMKICLIYALVGCSQEKK